MLSDLLHYYFFIQEERFKKAVLLKFISLLKNFKFLIWQYKPKKKIKKIMSQILFDLLFSYME